MILVEKRKDPRPWPESASYVNGKYLLWKVDGIYEATKEEYDAFVLLIKEGKVDPGSIYKSGHPNWNKKEEVKPYVPRKWFKKSKRTSEIYTIEVNSNGTLLCGCTGYNFHQYCYHCKEVREENNLSNLTIAEKMGRRTPPIFPKDAILL